MSYVKRWEQEEEGPFLYYSLSPEGDSNLASFMGELSCRPSLYTVYGTAKQMHAGGNKTSLAKHQHES